MVLVRTVNPITFNQKIHGLALSQNVLPIKEKLILEHVRIAPTTQTAKLIGHGVQLKDACIHRKC